MGWRLRGATVCWCCVIFMSTAGVGQVGLTGALPLPPERPPASVTQPEWRPPVRIEGAHRASSTSVSSGARRGAGLEVAGPLLQAYRTAALVVSPDCHLPVSLLAAIGEVESGNLRGRSLDAGHRVVPQVRGPVLDGGSFARVPDTDDGVLDGDRTWDRAVGPMQFLPATWIAYAVDLDGDGRLDPQDVEDAAGSAAVYLCQSGGDLAEPASLRTAVLTYNHSRAYLRLVLAWMEAYDEAGLTAGSGLAALPAVLVRSGRETTDARTSALPKPGSRETKVQGPVRSRVAAGPRSAGLGRDPVRAGGGWSAGTAGQPGSAVEGLAPCVTDLPATDPPATDPPATDPATDPPATDPPATDPPATDPPATDPPATEPSPTDATELPTPEPEDPPLVTCAPQEPGDPSAPADPATGTDPEEPDEPEPCAACAP